MKDAKKFCEMCEAVADISDKECWNCGNTVFNDPTPEEPNNDEIRRAAETLRNAPVPTEGRYLLEADKELDKILIRIVVDRITHKEATTALIAWKDREVEAALEKLRESVLLEDFDADHINIVLGIIDDELNQLTDAAEIQKGRK